MSALNFLLSGQGVSGGGSSGLYVDDVFSTYTYTGNGASQTIVNGIDLATYGGSIWIKNRTQAVTHAVHNTERGFPNQLVSNSIVANAPSTTGVTSVSSTGYSVGAHSSSNTDGINYVSWTFRNAPRFYGHQLVTKSAGSNRTISFPELGTLGMVRVKRTDAAGSWYVWHRSLSAGQLLIGETTAAATALEHVTVSGTAVTLVNGVIADGTYLVEAWAHDEASDGIIQCGMFTTDSSGNATVNLGWEPQYLLTKRNNADLLGDWRIFDNQRGWSSSSASRLFSNLSSPEASSEGWCVPTSTGYSGFMGDVSATYIYLAIRRPNKPPTSGTQVYNAIARTGTGDTTAVTGVGFAADLVMSKNTLPGQSRPSTWWDRLRGSGRALQSSGSSAEYSVTTELTGFGMDGYSLGIDNVNFAVNAAGHTFIHHLFRRAPGFMDIVCDTGTGAAHTIQHNLADAPQLMIRKARGATTDWQVWHSALAANEYLTLNSNAAKATSSTVWNNTLPTSSVFSVGTNANTNTFNVHYVTYLFSTLAGISKVGSYTGNGSAQTIPCGFSTGSRLVLIKRIDNAGDWFVWDTARGITPTTDPHLSLNITAAEVTTDDSIDQHSTGFIAKQNSATNINVLGASYLFLAIS